MSKKTAKVLSGKKLVIVESPTKAKTIKKFLGKNYFVESCMGHIRDLPKSAKDIPEKYKKLAWSKLGVDTDHDFEPLYCIPNDKKKVVSHLKELVDESDEIYLATDEDREGESISWHLLEVLKPKVPVKRMVFNEITESAIQAALQNTRKIDDNLVHAQEARRILDRLVGYTLSPVIWKKIAFGLSAGRVQSVAIKLICERELARLRFKKADYCGIDALCDKSQEASGQGFLSRLSIYKDMKIAIGKDFDPETGQLLKKSEYLQLSQKEATKIQGELKGKKLNVDSVEDRPISRSPYAPFITSTLQQDASRKFSWASRNTMRTAQQLYEQGLITYMRTDSTFLSDQAIQGARDTVLKLYGKEFLPSSPRTYEKKKVKGAQEAHEAIRPAGTKFVHPAETGLKGDNLKLYDLIWKRTVASQMQDSKQKQTQVRLSVGDSVFSASGTVIEFPGFLKVYEESRDDSSDSEDSKLPPLKKGDSISVKKLEVIEHETKPPSRFTEAGLIQVMEKEGIGRPSTYAATIGTIQDRGYVLKANNSLKPTFTAMVVVQLLEKYFPEYVDLKFTSDMENSLDEIAQGDKDWVSYLKDVYGGKSGLKKLAETQDKKIDPDEARAIRLVGLEEFTFKVGRYGAYVCRKEKGEEICASLPESHAPSEVTAELINKLIDQKINGADSIGKDPNTQKPIYVLNGRYGPYVQLGESDEEKPKRVSIPPSIVPENITFKEALKLIGLPETLGTHPETKKEIKMSIGRFGPYIVHDGDFRSIPKTDSVFTMDLKRALEMLKEPKKGRGKRASALKEIGKHPDNNEAISLMDGKYGPYIKWGKINVSIPEGEKPDSVNLASAIELLATKAGSKKTKKASKNESAKKESAKKEKIVAAETAAPVKASGKISAGKVSSKAMVKKPNSKAARKPQKTA